LKKGILVALKFAFMNSPSPFGKVGRRGMKTIRINIASSPDYDLTPAPLPGERDEDHSDKTTPTVSRFIGKSSRNKYAPSP